MPLNPNHGYMPLEFDHTAYILIIIVMLYFVEHVYLLLIYFKDKLTKGKKGKEEKKWNAEVFVDEAIDPYF